MMYDRLLLDGGLLAGLFPLAGGLEIQAFLHGARSPARDWALGFIVAGGLGLIVLVALILAWLMVRRRRRAAAATASVHSVATQAALEPPPAPPEPVVWGALWVRLEDAPVQVFQLTEPAVTMGRDPANGLPLADERLSERHAELRHEGGAAVLYDLGSPGGTSVNHTRITGSRRLSPGDVITLGGTELVYRPPSRVGGTGGRLVVTQGQSEPSLVDLSVSRQLYIGQSASCDVVIPDDPGVSRRHAQVQRTAGGHEIMALESTTGVLVNGRPVSRAHLRPGDQIRLGDTEFLYE